MMAWPSDPDPFEAGSEPDPFEVDEADSSDSYFPSDAYDISNIDFGDEDDATLEAESERLQQAADRYEPITDATGLPTHNGDAPTHWDNYEREYVYSPSEQRTEPYYDLERGCFVDRSA